MDRISSRIDNVHPSVLVFVCCLSCELHFCMCTGHDYSLSGLDGRRSRVKGDGYY